MIDSKADRPVEIEITQEMIEAGLDRLIDLLVAGASSVYVVSEVYQAMEGVALKVSQSHREEGRRNPSLTEQR